MPDSPNLLFTNAGMNQFKDVFLGNAPVRFPRIANTQKCLRVSGKHNDLEEVGHDGYHHTMFEMLGNWSFGDYFKKEAIAWAWEFLSGEMKIPADRLYATVFEGSRDENIAMDREALDLWRSYLDESHILTGSKKDNFWEMGDSGPCGPCSEVHVDVRTDEARRKKDGRELVNKGDPQVIEIWNLVFIQYNRRVSGELVVLPKKHVDTGMGFERLCMVVQGKTSNYDTDIFQPVIRGISSLTGIQYGTGEKTDVAMKVIADHLRAIAFAIADGQMPSNTKAGYVIRRILRRAVRYNYTFMGQNNPMIFKLVPFLIGVMGKAFPELAAQRSLIERVIFEEEQSFLHTLENGDKRLKESIAEMKGENRKELSGKVAFDLYDTYGFPLDLTELILKENGFTVNTAEFDREMTAQRKRSKSAASVESDDWIILGTDPGKEAFVGYDSLTAKVRICRYRKVTTHDKQLYHLVFDQTPFYAESGGQVGDVGFLRFDGGKIKIINTFKEHGLIIHATEMLPPDTSQVFEAGVSAELRMDAEKNHTATHLLHYALREVLGKHVEQKGSLVNPDYLRFDFSYFQKMTEEETDEVEKKVNRMIAEGIERKEMRAVPMEEAKKMGAMALFGEKYGDAVRVIQFGNSVELCGGTHVDSTSRIGLFKILSEGSIAAGVRRIEAITGEKALIWYMEKVKDLRKVEELLNHPQDVLKAVSMLVDEKGAMQKQLEKFTHEKAVAFKAGLLNNIHKVNDFSLIAAKAGDQAESAAMIREVAFQLRRERDDLVLIIGAEFDGKPHLAVMVSDKLTREKKLHAGEIARNAAREFDGGGGGQPFFGTAGGRDPGKIDKAIEKAKALVMGEAANK
jgi:alanyl-tRNA synthetase